MRNIKRVIFLVDGAGALISAFFLGLVLPAFQEYIGMPLAILHFLAVWALFYAFYSLACLSFLGDKTRLFLMGIIVLNLIYALATLSLVGIYWQNLEPLGLGYFLCEVAIILSLVKKEIGVLKKA